MAALKCIATLCLALVLHVAPAFAMASAALDEDGPAASESRLIRPIDAGWQFRKDGEPESAWRPVAVPSSLEEAAGTSFDGVGWYRVVLDRKALPPGRSAWLRLDAAATAATVWCDGVELGSHLGGWTRFRLDLTGPWRAGEPERPVEIRVRLDETVGHNTQGFLPIVQPHFGGIWQPVTLETLPEVHVDDLRLLAVGDPASGTLTVEAPIVGADASEATIAWRLAGGTTDWSAEHVVTGQGGRFRATIPVPEPRLWSPASPALYEVRVRLPGHGDEVVARAAFRSIRAEGRTLRLNGEPLNVRGVLNWGYYPPRLAPVPDLPRFRRDLELARARGFNLVKFCLWVPPRAYLDLCDELGMLAWAEYPTWHPKLDPQHRVSLEREFAEFFAHDRNHPSVILRSLTCETGTSADLAVVKGLYDRGKAMIPGALIEDDSSWIEWQRVHDFYDDHPYGNNHTWVATLDRLRSYIADHGPKPLVLGEAIAADTWTDPDPLLARLGAERPYWAPGFLDASAAWRERMKSLHGPAGVDRLGPDSLRYALAMRRYQIETYRREVPEGGYVVSVARDFPLAAMGLLDFDDQPKWSEADWAWHRETMLLLATPGDRRAFENRPDWDGAVSVRLSRPGAAATPDPAIETNVEGPAGPQPDPSTPRRVTVRAHLDGLTSSANAWDLWLVPPADIPKVRLHGSVDPKTARLFPDAGPVPSGPAADETAQPPLVARRFDPDLLSRLEAGARVLMLPDGQKGSFATANHWFLRGGPYVPEHAMLGRVPRDLLVDLQAFDLAGPVLPRIDPYLDQVDPFLLLWDNHDLKEVRTHGLVFETGFGKGRLLVSALAHGPAENAAGRWLLAAFLDHLARGPEPRHGLSRETLERLREKVGERTIDLSERPWRFRPDPGNSGLESGWERPGLETAAPDWTDLRIDRHWESQGHETLDGWAWYRTTVAVPADWKGRDVYVSFQGADDYYELYVDGRKAGTGGDIATKTTAFEERKSHRVTDLVEPGQACTIAVRIYDWYGAGGLFRPVLLGTARIGARADWIR